MAIPYIQTNIEGLQTIIISIDNDKTTPTACFIFENEKQAKSASEMVYRRAQLTDPLHSFHQSIPSNQQFKPLDVTLSASTSNEAHCLRYTAKKEKTVGLPITSSTDLFQRLVTAMTYPSSPAPLRQVSIVQLKFS